MSIRIGTQLVSQYLKNGNGVDTIPLTVNPSTTLQTFTPNANEAYSTVTVNPVTNKIDSNIVSKNIKKGVTILGVTGILSSDSSMPSVEFMNIDDVLSILEENYTENNSTEISTELYVSGITFEVSNMGNSMYFSIVGESGKSMFFYVPFTTAPSAELLALKTGDYIEFYSDTFTYIPEGYNSGNLLLNGKSQAVNVLRIVPVTKSFTNQLIDRTIYTISSNMISDLTEIGAYCFANCTNLTYITFPNTLQSIKLNAFRHCLALKTIKIPNSVTFIGDSAFYNCVDLTSVQLSTNLPSIEQYTFALCTSLNSITIPTSVTKIDSYAFTRCDALTSITYAGTMAQWSAITLNDNWNYTSAITQIVCTDGTINL